MDKAAAVKKTKAAKTFADYQAKTQERRDAALESAVKLFQIAGKALSGGGPDNPANIDEAIRATQKRICSYLGSVAWLKSEWTPNGIRITLPPKEGYRGFYRVRIIPEENGFHGQIWHFEASPDPEAKKPIQVVDYTTGYYAFEEAAKEAAYEYAQDVDIQHRIIRVWRVWYEGERDFEADKGGLQNMRQAALSCITRLVMEGGKPANTPEQVDTLIAACQKPLLQYHSCLDLFNSRWDASGNWIGPTKPTPKAKGKKATKPVAHYLANFQKVIERNNFEEADNRILHAFRNNFPVEDLKRYEVLARPFQDKLANYSELLKKTE